MLETSGRNWLLIHPHSFLKNYDFVYLVLFRAALYRLKKNNSKLAILSKIAAIGQNSTWLSDILRADIWPTNHKKIDNQPMNMIWPIVVWSIVTSGNVVAPIDRALTTLKPKPKHKKVFFSKFHPIVQKNNKIIGWVQSIDCDRVAAVSRTGEGLFKWKNNASDFFE